MILKNYDVATGMMLTLPSSIYVLNAKVLKEMEFNLEPLTTAMISGLLINVVSFNWKMNFSRCSI